MRQEYSENSFVVKALPRTIEFVDVLALLLFLFGGGLSLLAYATFGLDTKTLIISIFLFALPVGLLLFIKMTRELSVSGKIIFFVMSGYYLLFSGFAYLHLPIGIPIYVGEIAIVLLLLFTRHQLKAFSREPICWLALTWLLIGLPQLIVSLPINPINTLRNFSPAYYTIFIYFGYSMMLSLKDKTVVWQYFGRVSLAALAYYAVIEPIRVPLYHASPQVGNAVPLLGNFPNGFSYAIAFSAWWLVLAPHYVKRSLWVQVFAILVMFECVVIEQARSGYIQIFLLFALLLLVRKHIVLGRLIKPLAFSLGIAVVLGLVVGGLGFTVQGTKSVLSWEYFSASIVSMMGDYSTNYEYWDAGEGMVNSAYGRIDWWEEVATKVFETAKTTFLGLGFHQALGAVPGINTPVELMNAHGTYATILGRFGLIGLVCCLSIYALSIKYLILFLRRVNGLKERATVATLIVVFILFGFASIWGAWFDSPFHAIPFYLLIGLALGYSKDKSAIV